MSKPLWILGITRGHNASVCLLKDGEIIFSIEEERLSRTKYDGSPFVAMSKVKEYTDKVDYLVVAHTQPLSETAGKIDFTGDNMYTGMARKLGLIARDGNLWDHPQVFDYSYMHHKLHASAAFYRSGFKEAAALIVDGAGTFIDLKINNQINVAWEVESIFNCSYPHNFKTLYKHVATRGNTLSGLTKQPITTPDYEFGDNEPCEFLLTERCGVVKAYEAVTKYCGFEEIEAGKTMGLFPYGKPNDKIAPIFDNYTIYPLVNRNMFTPTYPGGANVNNLLYDYLYDHEDVDRKDAVNHQNRRDLAYAVQTATQREVLRLILKTSEMSGQKNIVLSGGYALNCVANYHYLSVLKDFGINLYVEPISSDAGTSIGAALYHHYLVTGDVSVRPKNESLYLGPTYEYNLEEYVEEGIELVDANYDSVVDLLTNKNIVSIFQGKSENGPRALGNRSILFDPTFVDGKDFVNEVKRREYFRPFAATVLADKAEEWFDMRGLTESPSMMYAVNCKDGVAEKVPSVIHVDGTCRIQTVTEQQNKHFYNLIKTFEKKKNVPMLFNTSFNLAGDPLVETLEDAINTLKKSDIDYLYMPEYNKMFIIKKEKS